MNVVAPDLAAFLPGDLVGVTVVIAARPQQFSTPTSMPELLMPSLSFLERIAEALDAEVEIKIIPKALQS